MLDWIIQNKEWFFSGAGVAVVTIAISLIVKTKSIKQKQEIGDNSSGFQVGGDVNYRVGDKDGNN